MFDPAPISLSGVTMELLFLGLLVGFIIGNVLGCDMKQCIFHLIIRGLNAPR